MAAPIPTAPTAPVQTQTAPGQSVVAPLTVPTSPTQAPPAGETPAVVGNETTPVETPPLQARGTDFLMDLEPTDAPPTMGDDGKPLLAGKYKDVGALETAYKELESRFTKITQVPEKYEVDPVFKAEGMQWKDAVQENHVTEAFKGMRLSQEQATGLLKLYKESMTDVLAQYGPPVDPAFEKAALQREWGPDFQNRQKAVAEFAKTLPKEVLTTPLAKTAAGMQVIERLMQMNRSPTVIKDTKSGVTNVAEMRAQLGQLARDPKYYSDPALQKKAAALSSQISELEQQAQ